MFIIMILNHRKRNNLYSETHKICIYIMNIHHWYALKRNCQSLHRVHAEMIVTRLIYEINKKSWTYGTTGFCDLDRNVGN